MIIYAEVNGKKYNMYYIVDFVKSGDTEIVFTTSNGYKETETFDSTDDRDDAYDKLEQEFVKTIN